jgi:hypothetical protein
MIQSIHELTYSFTAWPSLALAVVLLHCKSQYKQRLLFLCLCSSADTPSQPAVNPTCGSVIGRPARNQPTEAEPTLLHRTDKPQAELAFYLQFVLPRYGVGQISNVVILNSALESEKV